MPIYNAPLELDACIGSLIENTTIPARLILIDDASPDPTVRDIMSKWLAHDKIEAYRNNCNIGFTKTVNSGFEISGSDDVVILNSDTIVTPRWLEGLSYAAHIDENVATVTAISNNAGAFSVPEAGEDNTYCPSLDVAAVARIISRKRESVYPIAPTGNGFCMYIRRTALNQIGYFDSDAFPRGYGEENDFCMRARSAGYINIIDDKTFVYHKRSASFGKQKSALTAQARQILTARYPNYGSLIHEFSVSKAMSEMRLFCAKALREAEWEQSTPLPRFLYVIATQTGGTPQTNQDLIGALSGRLEAWVLRCDTRAMYLSVFKNGNLKLVEEIRLESPITFIPHRSDEYDQQFARILQIYCFELVHVRHIGWHSFGLFDVCENLQVPVVKSFHDFYAICPTVKLLDGSGNYCGGRCTTSPGPCTAELWPFTEVPELKHHFVYRWREAITSVLSKCAAFVTTSEEARTTFVHTYDFLAQADFRVIQHGRNFAEMLSVSVAPTSDECLRVLVPGNISAAKGALLVQAVAALDVSDKLEFHVLGDPGKLRGVKNVIAHGKYQREEFQKKVSTIRPHVGVVFSIWPETYCHTLTEMWACGIPVVGFDIGAVGERLATHMGGWLLDKGSTPEEIYAFLLSIKKGLQAFDSKLAAVQEWQCSEGAHYTSSIMAAHYDRLYRDVINRRRAFQLPLAANTSLRNETVVISQHFDDFTFLPNYAFFDRGLAVFGCPPDLAMRQCSFFPSSSVVLCRNVLESADISALVHHLSPNDARLCLDLRGLDSHCHAGWRLTADVKQGLIAVGVIAIGCDYTDLARFSALGAFSDWLSPIHGSSPSIMRTDQQEPSVTARSPAESNGVNHPPRSFKHDRRISIIVYNIDGAAVQLASRIASLAESFGDLAEVLVLDYNSRCNGYSHSADLADVGCDVTSIECHLDDNPYELLRYTISLCRSEIFWFAGGEMDLTAAPTERELSLFADDELAFVFHERRRAETDDGGWQARQGHDSLSEVFPIVAPELVFIRAGSLFTEVDSGIYSGLNPTGVILRKSLAQEALPALARGWEGSLRDVFDSIFSYFRDIDAIGCIYGKSFDEVSEIG